MLLKKERDLPFNIVEIYLEEDIEKNKENIHEKIDNIKKGKIELRIKNDSVLEMPLNLSDENLEFLKELKEKKMVSKITINEKIENIDKISLKYLKQYKVDSIILNVFSFDEYILKNMDFKYKSSDIKKKAKEIRKKRFKLGINMQVGTPGHTKQDELDLLKQILKLSPHFIIITPILIFENTNIYDMYEKKEYLPLKLEEAVQLIKEMINYLEKSKYKNIEFAYYKPLKYINKTDLKTNQIPEFVEGPYFEDLKLLVLGAVYFDKLSEKIKKYNIRVKKIIVRANPKDVRYIVGINEENIIKIKEIYDIEIEIEQDLRMKPGNINIKPIEKYTDFKEETGKI